MNKQEAIKYFKAKKDKYIVPPSDIRVSIAEVIDVISQIHEPQRVLVPKFVALRIEKYKNSNKSLYQLLDLSDDKEFNDWLLPNGEVDASRCDVLARAWLDGYEIEREKLYTVEIPNPNATHDDAYILGRTLSGSIAIWRSIRRNGNKNYESDFQLTESEIKQDFEWAWQFREEVE